MAAIGAVLGDRYRLIELVSASPRSSVYRATDAVEDRDVIVELFAPEAGADRDALARLAAEAETRPGSGPLLARGVFAGQAFLVLAMNDALPGVADRHGPSAPPPGAAAWEPPEPPSPLEAGPLPYAEDAYAGGAADPVVEPAPSRRGGGWDPRDDGPGWGPWVWVSAVLGLVILGIVGFLVFRLLTSGAAPPAEQVTVPRLLDLTWEQAESEASRVGLVAVRFAFEPSDKPADTILDQDPQPGIRVDKGSVVKLTLALGSQTATVPDLRGKTESQALNLIAAAGLTIGQRTEDFDPEIPLGSVIRQDPAAGLAVTKGLGVNYVVSKGPGPTGTPEATPTPTPTVEPITPPPSTAPTPTPTPTPPTPAPTLTPPTPAPTLTPPTPAPTLTSSPTTPATWTVDPSVAGGAGGSISPATSQTVAEGQITQFVITPDSGFAIDSVGGTCGGTLDGDGSTYTTAPITADCTVIATFVATSG